MLRGFGNLVQAIRLEISVLIILPIFLFFLLLIGLLYLPFLVYRRLVILLASCFRPELTQPLNYGNRLFALDSILDRPKANIVSCFVMDGKLGDMIEEVRAAGTRRVLEKRKTVSNKGSRKEDGQLVYPELKQVWTSFLGYHFWKNETNFDIKEHFRLYDFVDKDGYKLPEVCTQSDLQELGTRLLTAPWKSDFSPWEVMVVPNYKYQEDDCSLSLSNGCRPILRSKQQSVIIVRFHHSMGDGKNWMGLVLQDLLQFKEPIFPNEALAKSYHKTRVWRTLLAPLKLPYDYVKTTVKLTRAGENVWHTPGKRAKSYFCASTTSISSQFIKDLKNKFGVSYVSVLMCAISGAIRRVMSEAGQPVPKTMGSVFVFPMPNHTESLQVHATFVPQTLPIGTENTVERLRKIQLKLGQIKSNTYPLAFNYLLRFLNAFPNFVLRSIYNKGRFTMAASLFPGPMTIPQYDGCDILDSMLFLGHCAGQTGAVASSVVMGGKQRILVTIDKSLFPSAALFKKMGSFIEDELKTLDSVAGRPIDILNEKILSDIV